MTMSSAPSIDELTSRLSRTAGWLESPAEAAAHLESIGYTDADARGLYGYESIFSLATEITSRQRTDDALISQAWDEERIRQKAEWQKHKPESTFASILRFFFRGVAYGMPMAIMTFSIFALLYSLWAYYYFTVTRATAIGVGTALSYLITGGFMQAIGRRGLMYLRQGMYMLCLRVSLFFIAMGLVLTAVIGFLLFLFLSIFPIVSVPERSMTILYYVTLSILWLCLSVLYMLQREFLFSLTILLGIGAVFVAREAFGWNIVAAHQVGILLAAAFAIGSSLAILLYKHHRTKDEMVPLAVTLPRVSILLQTVGPYFIFGILYFVHIFLDRILAWTGRMPFRQTFIWFRTDYEVGENWALLGLLPAFGAIEYALYRFSGFMKPRQIEYNLTEVGSFRSWFLHFFRRQAFFFIGMAIVGVLVAYFGIRSLLDELPEIGILLNDVSIFVFFVAAVGYLLAAFGLHNVSVFFWLARPRLAIISILPALLVNFVVGFLLSRGIAYYWAIVGFTLGSAVFAAVSLVLVLRVLSRLDYYFYSAV